MGACRGQSPRNTAIKHSSYRLLSCMCGAQQHILHAGNVGQEALGSCNKPEHPGSSLWARQHRHCLVEAGDASPMAAGWPSVPEGPSSAKFSMARQCTWPRTALRTMPRRQGCHGEASCLQVVCRVRIAHSKQANAVPALSRTWTTLPKGILSTDTSRFASRMHAPRCRADAQLIYCARIYDRKHCKCGGVRVQWRPRNWV